MHIELCFNICDEWSFSRLHSVDINRYRYSGRVGLLHHTFATSEIFKVYLLVKKYIAFKTCSMNIKKSSFE